MKRPLQFLRLTAEKLTLYRRAPTARRRILRGSYQRNGIVEIGRSCRYRGIGLHVKKRIMCIILFEPEQRYRDIVIASPAELFHFQIINRNSQKIAVLNLKFIIWMCSDTNSTSFSGF